MNYYQNMQNDNFFNNNDFMENNLRNCCIKRVEETYSCCPSYYSEEKYEDKKEETFYPCYEGTFTIYPTNSHCNKRCHVNKCNNEKDEKYGNKCHRNKCCFCNIFGNRW